MFTVIVLFRWTVEPLNLSWEGLKRTCRHTRHLRFEKAKHPKPVLVSRLRLLQNNPCVLMAGAKVLKTSLCFLFVFSLFAAIALKMCLKAALGNNFRHPPTGCFPVLKLSRNEILLSRKSTCPAVGGSQFTSSGHGSSVQGQWSADARSCTISRTSPIVTCGDLGSFRR